MPIAFKKGDVVRQVAPVIQGAVVDVAIVDGDVQFCVEYTGADGDVHQRFFTEAEIETAPEA
jgi:hypothetical protein